MSNSQIIDNRFEIGDMENDLLGEGGMGKVYRGIDQHTGQPVAVKMLKPDVVSSSEIVARFKREGETLRAMNHPNIVKMVDAVKEAGQYSLVMEYIPGGSLAALLEAQGALPVARGVRIALEVADALARVHHLGIIHRDLKPANVLLAEDGTPRLTDFGLARPTASTPLTQAGMLVGTMDYLSPEACQGEPPDGRMDIWAFGVMLFEMLSGQLPFTGETFTAKLTAILTQPAPDLASLRGDVPETLIDLIDRMLEKDPAQRIASMRQVAAELEAILQNLDPEEKSLQEPGAQVKPGPDQLKITLFGGLAIQHRSKPVQGLSTHKVEALLVYLACKRQEVSREELATLFWEDQSQEKALASLRVALTNLRKHLEAYLTVSRSALGIPPGVDVWLDVQQFDQHMHLGEYEQAIALYRGDFLQGFYLRDSTLFEDWVRQERERYRKQYESGLHILVDDSLQNGWYPKAIAYSRQLLQANPLDEGAHRDLMRSLVYGGQRSAALTQYEQCCKLLEEELGVEPEEATTALYQQIREGALATRKETAPGKPASSVHLPVFFEPRALEGLPEKPFVAREGELATLDGYLTQMLAGHAQVVFLSGSAGQGKSTLIKEFVQRATQRDPQMLAVQGACNAYSGVGDAYLPFRDVMGMLSGDVESLYTAGAIRREHALRLWNAMPDTLQALMEHGENLLDVLVPGERLLSRVASSIHSGTRAAQDLAEALGKAKAGSASLEQSHVFEQFTNVLREIAEVYPLVITLDDMQWADTASTSLLFHIGRRLQGNRVLILCAYRPEEVTQSAKGDRHPLEKILSEFKRQYGDTCIDLVEAEKVNGRNFIDAFLASEPNRLGEGFRQTLFAHTKGHPLFTIELLRAMQERGDLVQQDGAWVEGPSFDWEVLPPRVEAVIEERIGRLEAELREILTIASVEGEDFTAQVVARVQKADERKLIQQLGQELNKRYRLVGEEGVRLSGKQRLYRYRFQHSLFQQYMYQSLGENERGVLHEEVANVLEALYAGHVGEIAPQLAYHYCLAGNREKAVTYLTMAGDQAQARYANHEAVGFFTQGLELTDENEREARYRLLLGRDKVNIILGGLEKRKEDLAALEALAAELGDISKQAEIAIRRAHFEDSTSNYQSAMDASLATIQFARENGDIASEAQGFMIYGSALWHKGDYDTAREKLLTALELAETAHHPYTIAHTLITLGIVDYEQNNFQRAIEYYRRCLAIYQEIGDQINVGYTLNSLGTANVALGNLAEAEGYFEKAWSIFRETGDRRGEAFIYTCLAQLYFMQGNFSRVVDYYERGLAIFRYFGDRNGESIVLNNLGEAACYQGDYTKGYDYYQQTLDLCRQIESRSGAVYALYGVADSLFGLGKLDEAGSFFRQAIDLGEELGMRDNAMESRAGLARVHMAQGELVKAYGLVSEILAFIDEGHALRAEAMPFQLYWTCYQVLKAAQDPRAREFLGKTYHLLTEQAGKIHEETARRAFLENIPWNRDLMLEARTQGFL
jgi:adenylate cyclase